MYVGVIIIFSCHTDVPTLWWIGGYNRLNNFSYDETKGSRSLCASIFDYPNLSHLPPRIHPNMTYSPPWSLPQRPPRVGLSTPCSQWLKTVAFDSSWQTELSVTLTGMLLSWHLGMYTAFVRLCCMLGSPHRAVCGKTKSVVKNQTISPPKYALFPYPLWVSVIALSRAMNCISRVCG